MNSRGPQQALADHLLGFCDLAGVNPTEKESDLVGVLRTGVVPSLSETQQPSLNLAEKPNAPSSSLILGEDRLAPLLPLRLIALRVWWGLCCSAGTAVGALLSVPRQNQKTVGLFRTCTGP